MSNVTYPPANPRGPVRVPYPTRPVGPMPKPKPTPAPKPKPMPKG